MLGLDAPPRVKEPRARISLNARRRVAAGTSHLAAGRRVAAG